jgi:hypothetical protein
MTEIEKIKTKLMELPDSFNGILFVDRRAGINTNDITHIQTKANVCVIFCNDVEAFRLFPIQSTVRK